MSSLLSHVVNWKCIQGVLLGMTKRVYQPSEYAKCYDQYEYETRCILEEIHRLILTRRFGKVVQSKSRSIYHFKASGFNCSITIVDKVNHFANARLVEDGLVNLSFERSVTVFLFNPLERIAFRNRLAYSFQSHRDDIYLCSLSDTSKLIAEMAGLLCMF